MTERPSPGEQLAGIAGLALFLIMFLFAWYSVDAPGVNGFDAFDSFGDWFNILLVSAAVGGIELAVFGSDVWRLRVPLSVVTTVLGGICTIILIIYIISPPGLPTFGEAAPEIDLDRDFGVWLGLISLIALTIGGYMTMQEEGVTFGGAADRLSDRGPAPGQQPPAQQPPQQQAPPPPPPQQQAPPPPPPQQPPPPPTGG
jgi:hypothetical protein